MEDVRAAVMALQQKMQTLEDKRSALSNQIDDAVLLLEQLAHCRGLTAGERSTMGALITMMRADNAMLFQWIMFDAQYAVQDIRSRLERAAPASQL